MSAGNWLILGASSAMARALARQVAETGASVFLAGRDTRDLGGHRVGLRPPRRAGGRGAGI